MVDLFTGPARTNLFVLASLLIATGNCLWMLRPRVADPSWRFRLASFGGSLIPMVVGFWFSLSTDSSWIVIVTVTTLVLVGLTLYVLDLAAQRHSHGVAAPAVAVVLATSTLLLLGSLLVVRLVVVRDPALPFGAGLAPDALEIGKVTLIQPMALAIAAALACWWLVRFRSGPGWIGAVRGGLDSVAGLRVVRRFTAAWSATSDRPQQRAEQERARVRVIGWGALLAMVLFALPRLSPPTNNAYLYFGPIATPEWGKIFLLVVVAMMATRYQHRYGAIGGIGLRVFAWRLVTLRANRYDLLATWVKVRHVALPVGLFLLVAAASVVRKDFGTIVPVLAAMIGVTWTATRLAVEPTGAAEHHPTPASQRVRRTWAGYLVFLFVGALLFAAAGFVAWNTNYIHDRARVWADPWAYRWDAGCAPATVVPRDAPAEAVLCQQSLLANQESVRAHIGHVLATIVDGGLWGRGLRDTASGVTPAGDSDFILAVMWDKLGGLAVLLCALLVILLGAALRQLPRAIVALPWTNKGRPAKASVPVLLFAAGLAAMIVGNFLVVLLATVNLVPHTGIPAPFLSRGAQSTLALLAGIGLALGLTRPPSTAQTRVVAPAGRPLRYRRPALSGVLLPFSVSLGCVVVATLVPYRPGWPLSVTYDSRRPVCPVRAATDEALLSKGPGPAACSTDQIAYNRTRAEVRAGGVTLLAQQRPSGLWELVGTPPGGLVTQDLAGLLNIDGFGPGVVDQSFLDVLAETAGTTLHKRLSPPARTLAADAVVDLTIDPTLQHLATAALRQTGPPGAGPLAGGVVAIDATTGHILVSATAPPHTPLHSAGPAQTSLPADARAFLDLHDNFGPRTARGLDGSQQNVTCERARVTRDPDAASGCWLWQVASVGPDPAAEDERALRRYVDGDWAVDTDELPSPAINRAVGQRYGLGSTFKVVTAAAYLDDGGRADDLIEVPDVIQLAPSVAIHNVGGRCPNAVAGRISLRQAMSVSCNTAFVQLAIDLGWSKIAAQAQRFGLAVGACGEDDQAWLAHQLVGSASSCVPQYTDGVAIGNHALGGQGVQGTPLGMATVMAAAANAGTVVRPTLVRSWTYTGAGGVEKPGTTRQIALSNTAAAQLVDALSQTAVDGTAAGLARDVGAPLWVKTGTHEVVPEGDTLPAGEFIRVNSWLAGFLDTPHGPVAFAVVVEARDERTGGERVRHIAAVLCRAIRRNP